MYYLKICSADGTVVAAESIENPVYLMKQENGLVVRCPETKAQGVLSADGSVKYQLYGRDSLGVEDVILNAIFIAADEFEHLETELDDVERDEPVEETESHEEEKEPKMSLAEAKARIRELELINAQNEERFEFLEGCIMEIGDIIYG